MRVTKSFYARIERMSIFACKIFAVLCMGFAVLAFRLGLLGTRPLSTAWMCLLFVFAFVPYCAGHNYVVKGWLAKRVVL